MSGNHEVFDNRELLIKQQFFNTASYLPLGELPVISDKAEVSVVLERTEDYIKTMKEGSAMDMCITNHGGE